MEVFDDTFVPAGLDDVWIATRGCPSCLGTPLNMSARCTNDIGCAARADTAGGSNTACYDRSMRCLVQDAHRGEVPVHRHRGGTFPRFGAGTASDDDFL